VVSRGPEWGGYFTVTCSSGKTIRVYPRAGQHPRVTNESGGYNWQERQADWRSRSRGLSARNRAESNALQPNRPSADEPKAK